ncbi:MAG: nuclear transport factor 2 family protein [Pseudomonadales bacterium]|nr:nuclear transport factor 2 family protein [Pseudomonadales bacterium]
MDARSVGLRLVELARANQDATAVEELYDENIVSVEIMSDAEAEPQIGEGIQTIYEKHAWWESVATVHNIDIEGPFAGNGDDHFVVRFQMDVTMEGQRSEMTEVGMYTVANGKIIKEVYLGLVTQ